MSSISWEYLNGPSTLQSRRDQLWRQAIESSDFHFNLPNELWIRVFRRLEASDQSKAARVCKGFKALITPLLYSNIRLDEFFSMVIIIAAPRGEQKSILKFNRPCAVEHYFLPERPGHHDSIVDATSDRFWAIDQSEIIGEKSWTCVVSILDALNSAGGDLLTNKSKIDLETGRARAHSLIKYARQITVHDDMMPILGTMQLSLLPRLTHVEYIGFARPTIVWEHMSRKIGGSQSSELAKVDQWSPIVKDLMTRRQPLFSVTFVSGALRGYQRAAFQSDLRQIHGLLAAFNYKEHCLSSIEIRNQNSRFVLEGIPLGMLGPIESFKIEQYDEPTRRGLLWTVMKCIYHAALYINRLRVLHLPLQDFPLFMHHFNRHSDTIQETGLCGAPGRNDADRLSLEPVTEAIKLINSKLRSATKLRMEGDSRDLQECPRISFERSPKNVLRVFRYK